MNKFLRIIWTVNGVLILVLLLAGGIALLVTLFDNVNFGSQPEVIVGEKLEEAKAKGLILQGLTYEQPRPILYTDHFLLPVSIETYENPKQTRGKLDLSLGSGSSYAYTEEYTNIINIVFLNKQMEAQSALLDRKGFIESFRYPSLENSYAETGTTDTLQRHITYLIAFEDTNKDGLMDEGDNHDLYVSDLNGANLKKITSNIDVTQYYFLNRNQIMIKYQRRGNEPEEHRKEYFAVYSIKESNLKELSSLHDTLDRIESIIVK